MVEPFTTAAVAFAVGAVPPSVLLTQKSAELKEVAGDYSDKLELQQNAIKRKDDMVLAAQGESRVLLQSIAVLESRLQAAEQALTEAQAKLSRPSFSPVNGASGGGF